MFNHYSIIIHYYPQGAFATAAGVATLGSAPEMIRSSDLCILFLPCRLWTPILWSELSHLPIRIPSGLSNRSVSLTALRSTQRNS